MSHHVANCRLRQTYPLDSEICIMDRIRPNCSIFGWYLPLNSHRSYTRNSFPESTGIFKRQYLVQIKT